jgi:hypothetical protein
MFPPADVKSTLAPLRRSARPSVLKLAFSYKAEPVKIDAAVVGWTIKDKYFGVKFLDVKPVERLALDQYIASLAPLSLF